MEPSWYGKFLLWKILWFGQSNICTYRLNTCSYVISDYTGAKTWNGLYTLYFLTNISFNWNLLKICWQKGQGRGYTPWICLPPICPRCIMSQLLGTSLSISCACMGRLLVRENYAGKLLRHGHNKHFGVVTILFIFIILII